jgi:hypothetical protein
VRQFAEDGFDLMVAAEDGGVQLAADEIRAYGADVRAVQADLAEPGGAEDLYTVVPPLDARSRLPRSMRASVREGCSSPPSWRRSSVSST